MSNGQPLARRPSLDRILYAEPIESVALSPICAIKGSRLFP